MLEKPKFLRAKHAKVARAKRELEYWSNGFVE